MTPSVAASLIREAARGWTPAELAQFRSGTEDIYDAANEHDLDERYDEGYAAGKADGYDDGYADGEGEAETRSFDAALEDSTDN